MPQQDQDVEVTEIALSLEIPAYQPTIIHRDAIKPSVATTTTTACYRQWGKDAQFGLLFFCTIS